MQVEKLHNVDRVLPFDADYIKVGKGNKWNLMDKDGRFISENWFSSIERNTDGSIVTKVEGTREEVKFVDTASFSTFSRTASIVPAFVVNLVDSGSITPVEGDRRYVAKALFYGMTVYIKADGSIYDSAGNKLRILVNTVDIERLNNALVRLNKKLHFDYIPDIETSSWSDTIRSKKSIFAFYFATEHATVSCGYKNIFINGNISRWTDDLIIRACDKLMPEHVRNILTKAWGTPEFMKKPNEDYNNWTWHLRACDLDLAIETINSIE